MWVLFSSGGSRCWERERRGDENWELLPGRLMQQEEEGLKDGKGRKRKRMGKEEKLKSSAFNGEQDLTEWC